MLLQTLSFLPGANIICLAFQSTIVLLAMFLNNRKNSIKNPHKKFHKFLQHFFKSRDHTDHLVAKI